MVIIERQAKDHPAGGKYIDPSSSIKLNAKNIPAHNKASESDFAILDLLLKTKPNSNIETLQMKTMWSRNKTDVWLNNKTEEERIKIFKSARKNSEKMKDKFKQRRHQLLLRKKEILHEKQESKRLSDEKQSKRQAESANKLVSLNVTAWISVEEAKKNS